MRAELVALFDAAATVGGASGWKASRGRRREKRNVLDPQVAFGADRTRLRHDPSVDVRLAATGCA